jgi:hypothetical protein
MGDHVMPPENVRRVTDSIRLSTEEILELDRSVKEASEKLGDFGTRLQKFIEDGKWPTRRPDRWDLLI